MELSNPQDEMFCASVAAGHSATKSAKIAGHQRGAPNFAHRMMKRPEIQQRILELRATSNVQQDEDGNQIRSATVTPAVAVYTEKPWVVTELVATQRLARKMKDVSGAHQCLRTLAQIGGLLEKAPVLGDLQSRQSLALLGISEIHAMLSQVVGSSKGPDRVKLLAEAPELAELVGEITDAEPEAQAAESTPSAGV